MDLLIFWASITNIADEHYSEIIFGDKMNVDFVYVTVAYVGLI